MPAQTIMAEMIAYFKWLSAAEILLVAVLLVAMVRRGLARNYRVFFLFMALQSLVLFVGLFLDPARDQNAHFYFANAPVLWLIGIFVVYELYGDVFASYPGIVSFGKWVILGTFAFAVCVSLLTARYDWNLSGHESYPIIFYYTFTERGITTAQVIFLVSMTVFLRWFPAPLKRNVHVHTVILFLYFLCRSSSQLLRNLLGEQVTATTNVATMAASCLCVIGWIWQFSPELADRQVAYRKVDGPEERRILESLRAINGMLLGSAKRPTVN